MFESVESATRAREPCIGVRVAQRPPAIKNRKAVHDRDGCSPGNTSGKANAEGNAAKRQGI
eukprot:12690797-Alexandrium_andersonii.AAC.1